MAPCQRPGAALRFLARTLCGGAIWAALTAEGTISPNGQSSGQHHPAGHTKAGQSSGHPHHAGHPHSGKSAGHASHGAHKSHQHQSTSQVPAAAAKRLLGAPAAEKAPKAEVAPPALKAKVAPEKSQSKSEVDAAQALELSKLKAALSIAQAEIEKFKSDKSSSSKLKADLSTAQGEIEKLKSDKSGEEAKKMVAQEKATHEADQKRLAAEVTAQGATIVTLRALVATKSKENSQLGEQIASKDTKISDLTAKVASKTEENSKISLESLARNTTIAGLRKDVTSKSEETSKLRQEIRNRDTEIEHLKLDVSGRRKDIDEKAKQLTAKIADNANLGHDLLSHKQKIEASETSIASLRSALDVKTKAHSKLQKQDQDLRKDHLKLHKEHKLLQAQYADPSVQHFFNAKAVKVYSDPGIEGARNKTFIYVLPSLRKRYATGQKFVKDSEAAVYSKLNAYVGTEQVDPWLPAVSGCLVYGTIIVPFICTVCCLTRIVCKLKPLLLFCHLDFLFTTLCAGIFAVYTGKEPLAAFAHHDASVYLFTQVICAVAFCLYFLMLCCAYCLAKSGTSEGCYRCMQLIGALPIAIIYYKHVWTPAMMDEMPHMHRIVESLGFEGDAVSQYAWVPYFPVSLLFLILLRLERLSWHASGATSTDKAGAQDHQMSIEMRSDVELATLYGEDPRTVGASPVAKKE